MSKVYITDTSLRDGSHSVSHQYTSADVAAVAGRRSTMPASTSSR